MPAATTPVAVCFGGPSPEHDVSILTGLQASRELVGAGRDVIGLYWSKTAEWFRIDASLEAADFVDGVPRQAEPLRLSVGNDGGFSAAGRLGRGKTLDVGVVLNACHGGPGEDGTLQSTLDLAGVPYTGPHAAGAALGLDKLAFAGIVAGAGLPTLPRVLLVPGVPPETSADELKGPLIVKPRFGGSSIGIKVVEDLSTAVDLVRVDPHMRRGAVVEPYRSDLFDLNVAMRLWPDVQLSAIERPLRSSAAAEILSYGDKYVGGEGMVSAPRELPAVLTAPLAHHLRACARQVARLTDVRGVARIDFLSDGETLFVNEINTVPGSLARYLWVDPPVPFIDLLDATLEEARARPSVGYSAAGADGTVLRGAGAIAAKLA